MIPLFDDAGVVQRRKTMVILIIALNALVFWYELTLGPKLQNFVYDYGLIPSQLAHNTAGQGALQPVWLTLFSSMFLHGGWLHIAGNMLFLWVFGDEIEGLLGSFGFLLFYLAGGCIAGLTQVFASPDAHVPTIGASGAIAAVLGAYIATFPRARVMTLVGYFFLFLPAWLVLGLWVLIQAFQGYVAIHGMDAVASNVAVWAHLGGFAFGVVMSILLRYLHKDGPERHPDMNYSFYNRRRPW
jgi:membrane associated rhomboid family serine protease